MGVLLVDEKGSRIYVRKHPRNRRTGQLIDTVPFVPGGEQYSIEEVLGHPIGGQEGIAEPQAYREYLLWWPDGRGFFGGAVLAAGLLLDNVEVLYGRTPLPPPIMEDRSFNVGLGEVGRDGSLGTRRRDDDFVDVDEEAASEQDEEGGPPKSS
ncbi:MAG: hypothetical protein WBA69_08770 [Mycobacterium sp.]